jgi:hypothetical protein
MILVILGEWFQSFDNNRNSFEFEIKWILCMSTDVEENLLREQGGKINRNAGD